MTNDKIKILQGKLDSAPKPEIYDIPAKEIKKLLKFMEEMVKDMSPELSRDERKEFLKNEILQQAELIKAGAEIGEDGKPIITDEVIEKAIGNAKKDLGEYKEKLMQMIQNEEKNVENEKLNQKLMADHDFAIQYFETNGAYDLGKNISPELFTDTDFIEKVIAHKYDIQLKNSLLYMIARGLALKEKLDRDTLVRLFTSSDDIRMGSITSSDINHPYVSIKENLYENDRGLLLSIRNILPKKEGRDVVDDFFNEIVKMIKERQNKEKEEDVGRNSYEI